MIDPPVLQLSVIKDFVPPRVTKGLAIGKKSKLAPSEEPHCEEPRRAVFPCTEDGCTFTGTSFQQLEDHVSLGMHHIPRISALDRVKLKWAERLENMAGDAASVMPCSTSRTTEASSVNMGWALKSNKPRMRHSQKVNDYLRAIWEEGTGRKKDPLHVAKNLKTARNEDGQKIFTPEEWLTAIQVAGIFSRYTLKNKQVETTDIMEDDAEVINTLQRTEARQALQS